MSITGFSKEAADGLVGKTVIKRVLQEENPAVKPGQIGKVVEARESEWADGFAVVVDWGDRELWEYATPESLDEDVRFK